MSSPELGIIGNLTQMKSRSNQKPWYHVWYQTEAYEVDVGADLLL
jgi:hypothetical protein